METPRHELPIAKIVSSGAKTLQTRGLHLDPDGVPRVALESHLARTLQSCIA